MLIEPIQYHKLGQQKTYHYQHTNDNWYRVRRMHLVKLQLRSHKPNFWTQDLELNSGLVQQRKINEAEPMNGQLIR